MRALSGDDNFAVPYWNFTDPAADKRKNPLAFRTATYLNSEGKEVPNPLYYKLRRGGINDEGISKAKPLCKEVVAWETAFAKDKFFVPAGEGSASFGGTKKGFLIHGILGPGTGALEDQPHNSVHATVGFSEKEGKEWEMTLFNAAGSGLDPLFWPIHANLDRAWDCWQANHPKTLPDDSSLWATQKFKFFDAEKVKGEWQAKEVCLTGKQVVEQAFNTTEKLDYVYKDCTPFPAKKKGNGEEGSTASRPPGSSGNRSSSCSRVAKTPSAYSTQYKRAPLLR